MTSLQVGKEAKKLIVARVFPRKTAASPDDGLAFFEPPPRFLPPLDEVHVSVAFSYDIPRAEMLAETWSRTGVTVKMGGPAISGQQPGDFTPGLYLRKGYVITSRGCPSKGRCWFCGVRSKEGPLRELPITEGSNVLDNNLLACSEKHIRAVFAMLSRQSERPIFTGGLEAGRLRAWHVDLLRESKTKRFYCAYDTADDYEPLVAAGKLLREGGITRESRKPNCYVLIGYPGDSMDRAEKRLRDTWAAGFAPYAMLYRNEAGETAREWRKFQRLWVRPQILFTTLKGVR